MVTPIAPRQPEQTAAEKLATARELGNWRHHVRPATAEDYSAWLKRYLDAGGEITWAYDYDMPEMWVAVEDFEMPALYGVDLAHLIVPSGVTVRSGNLGQSDLFLMEPARVSTPSSRAGLRPSVLAYADTSFEGLP